MRKYFIAVALLISAFVVAEAETWSLEQCVDYAIQHNISVRQAALQVEQGQLSVTSAKDAFLPNLSAQASEGFNFGRGLTADNTYANRNTSNFQWGVSMSLPLFNGLQDVRQLKASRTQLQQYLLENEAAKDDVTLNVISQYLQVLYSKEVLESARTQLDYSTYEVQRQQALVDAGKVAEATLYDAEALQAQDKLQVTTAENDVKVALVTLANLLQLPTADDFDVLPIDEELPLIPGPDVVYSRALETNHSILSAHKSIEVARDNISVARSGYLPRLNFNASFGSTYYTISGLPSDPFGTQMRNNLSTYLGFSLNIPIFDGFSTRNNVRRARLAESSALLELDRRESDLYKTIQLAYTQASGARDKYLASEETLAKTQLSFQATREKYNLGRSTPAEFEQAKNNLFKVEITRIQSLYEYLLRYRLLRFYETNRLTTNP